MDALDHAIMGLQRSCGLTQRRATDLRLLITSTESYGVSYVLGASAAPRLKLLIDGWAAELRILRHGRRQIFSFLLPGDVGLSRSATSLDVFALVALTTVTCVDVTQTLSRSRPPQRDELWAVMNHARDLGRERRYSQIRRLSLRSPLRRIADLLLELHDRLAAVGLATRTGFPTPLTCEQIADALAIDEAEVIRSFGLLEAKNLARLRGGWADSLDLPGLAALGDD